MGLFGRRDRKPLPEDGIPPDRITPMVAELENLANRFRAAVEDSTRAAAHKDDDEKGRGDDGC